MDENVDLELFLEFIQPEGTLDLVFLRLMLALSVIAVLSSLVAFRRSLKRREEIRDRYRSSRAEVMPSVDDIERELTGRADHITETIPPMLLVLGLLGTFIGVGLAVNSGANLFEGAAASGELEQLSGAGRDMAVLLKKVGFQFKTSVWGIFGNVTIGLVATFFVVLRKMRARRLYKIIVVELKELQNDRKKKEEERETLAAKVQTAQSVNLAAVVGRLDALYEQLARLPAAALTMREAANEMAAAGKGLRSSVDTLDMAIHALSDDNKKFLESARDEIKGATNRLTKTFETSMKTFETTVSTTLEESAGTISKAGTDLAASVTSMKETIEKMGDDNAKALREGNANITAATEDLGTKLETSMGSFQEATDKTLNKMTSDLGSQTEAIKGAVEKSRKSMDGGLTNLNDNVTASLNELKTQLDGTLTGLDNKLDGRLGALQQGIASMTDTTQKLFKVMKRMDGMNAAVRHNLVEARQHMEEQAGQFLKGRADLVEGVSALFGVEFATLTSAINKTNQLLSEAANQRSDLGASSGQLLALHKEISEELRRLERMERDLGALKQLQHEANKARTEHALTVATDDHLHR